ncbi:hypothetical protein Tco_0193928 [Tanacetum coccineum]
MSTILALSFPSSNTQLETLSDQVYQDAMKERHTLNCVDNSLKSNDDMARKYTHSNMVQHAEFFKQKILLVQLHKAGIQLSKDQLAILADTGERINFGPGAFIVITNALFQDDGVEVKSSSKQSSVVNHSETEITSDSNIIPYSHQAINCTKINLDNKSVNDSLTVELERYKEQSVEIDRLKQIPSEHVKEKESLMQTVTLLKNDFKKEESRNIDREIALEKKIKQLDNIVFKRDQSAQTVHMLTKHQFFYDHTTKPALGFQNSFYQKKAQQLEPKLYDGILRTLVLF